ncbi:THUMP domain-containing class I SAM-dependent RNA methyltransferase [Tenuibacillus multivorans]|uniref:Putative N6-adenine-specific DNA methylase n=1 Tax=Tenuibacillus multivorans TaxID=237069 RepID=A0A1H0CR89_9BACI|nr:class I SAM-dependent RNA methyltransferase [Tenuibacillus multivorans]GEL76193.1 RNA methyltransferase [Tenuibacillus multivorans]SDN60414.1 putative N6-adenine-specific DNA methylase [Tenuibacillus multivorans]
MSQPITLIATAAMGLESIVRDEVKQLGYKDSKTENGRIIYQSDLSGIARSNLWLRTADRVKLLMDQFKAYSFEELFEQTKDLPWEEWISKDGFIHVVGKSHKSKLYSVPDCQSIVKKAIVNRLQDAHQLTTRLEETGPRYKVEVSILKDEVTLSLDTSGSGLHKRGYRVGQGEAPLKETLAAALIKLTNWTPHDPFVDPFTGSGTIPIEAALIGQNIAPGFNREFSAEEWESIPSVIWDQALEEAEDLANYDQPLDIIGSDISHQAVEIAQNNALEAGLADLITWKQMQVKDFVPHAEKGYLIGNPPYGERLGDQETVEQIYRDLGSIMSQFPKWSVYIMTAYNNFESYYGQKATKKRKLFNGFIRTDYYQYFGIK